MRFKKLWGRMPTNWIHEGGLKDFQWSPTSKNVTNAHKIAALQLYTAISMTADSLAITSDEGYSGVRYASDATYNKLQLMTGLSRSSISGGLTLLQNSSIVEIIKAGRKNYYAPADYNGVSGWCKVPYSSVVNDSGQIVPFQAFKLRRKAELHALKLYLYLCYARPNTSVFTQVSYEKINKATGIPEKSIPRAYALLAGTELLARIDKAAGEEDTTKRAANSYYLTGYRDLHKQMPGSTT